MRAFHNEMTSEEKIKKALNFLLTTNAKGASFDYYDYKAGKNRYEDWLFKFFEREGIPENQHYPIVTELANRDLIEVHPPETKVDKTPPNQIKISFKGMALLDPNNQAAVIAKDEIKDLQIENLKLQNRDFKRRVPFAMISFISGALLSVGIIYLEKNISTPKQPNKEIIQLQGAIPQLKIDTNCQLSNPDTSVFDIILYDRESSIRQVGEKFAPIEEGMDMPYENFCTEDKKQTLTLFFHYGGFKNSFAEFQVKTYSPSDSAALLKTTSFVTNSGIKLGISKIKVVSILGNCFKTIQNDKSKEIIKYIINDFEHSSFLKRFNMPIYYAEYEFESDKLIRFRFGFEYP